LNQAAPDVFVQLNELDAQELGLSNGDFARVESRRGMIEGAVRIGGILPRHVFIPFHYGNWDDDSRPRAANELTLTEWDPVSKQPHFKYAAVKITKINRHSVAQAIRDLIGNAKDVVVQVRDELEGHDREADSKKHVAEYLGLLKESEHEIAEAFRSVAEHHRDEPDIFEICQRFETTSRVHAAAIERFTSIYGQAGNHEASQVRKSLFRGPRDGGFGLVRDLHDLFLLNTETRLGWMILLQTAHALRDREFISACTKLGGETEGQLSWLQTRIKQAAPQALLVDV
jgi:hypothetical protein